MLRLPDSRLVTTVCPVQTYRKPSRRSSQAQAAMDSQAIEKADRSPDEIFEAEDIKLRMSLGLKQICRTNDSRMRAKLCGNAYCVRRV